MSEAPQTLPIPKELAGLRLDQALAQMFPEYSRSRLKEWLLAGALALVFVPGWLALSAEWARVDYYSHAPLIPLVMPGLFASCVPNPMSEQVFAQATDFAGGILLPVERCA